MSMSKPGQTHLAAIHYGVGVGQVASKFKVLLDKQDSHIAARRQFANDLLNILDNRWLYALCRLIKYQ